MPELPEVETVASGVHARVRSQRILSVTLSAFREPFKTPAAEMAEALTGCRIERVHRVGKHIVFDLTHLDPSQGGGKTLTLRTLALQWIVHLGMTGRLLVSQPDVPTPKHTHAVLALSGGRELRFVDPRRFGRLALHRTQADTGFRGPGQEPLAISSDEFAALFGGRKTSIKAALLNQKLLHGVGNIYADESLFRAGIRPTAIAGRLSRKRLDRLRRALRDVLRNAIRLGGSSVSDYVDADGVKGFFQLEHRVYMRGGEPCLVCKAPIRRMVLAGRGTHYCPRCQR